MKKYCFVIILFTSVRLLQAQNALLSPSNIFQIRQQTEKFLDGYAANVRFLAKQNISVSLKKESKEYILRYFVDENVQVYSHITKKQTNIATYLDEIIGLEEADFTLETENAHFGLITKEKNVYSIKVNIIQSVADKQDMKKKYAQTLTYLLTFGFENKKVQNMKINSIEAGSFTEILKFDEAIRTITTLNKGQEINLVWTTNLINEMKITLLKNEKVERVIAEKVEMNNEGKGIIKWKVGTDLAKSYDYTLQVSTLDGQRSIITNKFAIVGIEKEQQETALVIKGEGIDSVNLSTTEIAEKVPIERENHNLISNAPQASSAERNLKVRNAAYTLLDTYRDVLRQIGRIDTPEEERKELKESLINQYFQKLETGKEKVVYIYNTIDPTYKTQKEFDNPDDFLSNLMLWYKEGYEYDLDIKNAQFGNIKREQDFYFVQINLQQKLAGRYLENIEKSILKHKLTFFVKFKLENTIKADVPTTIVKEVKINKISNAEDIKDKNRFIPSLKFERVLTETTTALNIGKQITYAIKWTTNVTDSLRIRLYKDKQPLYNITESAQNEVFFWTPSNELKTGSGYQFRLMTKQDTSFEEYSKVFSLIDKKYIRVLYPQIGDSLSKGDIIPITWESNVKGKYKVELLKGNTLIRPLQNETTQTSFNWQIPKDTLLLPSFDYQIRVSSAISDTVEGLSEGNFIISNLPTSPFIRLIKPTAGEGVKKRDKYLINWSHNLGKNANFEIILREEGKSEIQYINKLVASKDNFLWRVNPQIKEAKNYYVQVKSNNVIGRSNLFTIKNRPPWKWIGIGGVGLLAGLIWYLLPQQSSNALPEVGGSPK